VTSSPLIVCHIFRETIQLLLLPVKSYLVHIGRCVRRSGEGFRGLACGFVYRCRSGRLLSSAHVACFINHFLLPV